MSLTYLTKIMNEIHSIPDSDRKALILKAVEILRSDKSPKSLKSGISAIIDNNIKEVIELLIKSEISAEIDDLKATPANLIAKKFIEKELKEN